MNGNFQGGFAPVKEGEEHDVNIEGVGEKGDGIARVKGFVVFVPGVKEGDQVRIKITKVLRKVGFGEVIGQATGPVAEKEKVAEPEEEPEEEANEEDEALFDESKDSEDFGEEDSEEVPEDEKEPEEEPKAKKPKKETKKKKK
ncbi:MAG: TRAM domain-containing protein [archaeon]